MKKKYFLHYFIIFVLLLFLIWDITQFFVFYNPKFEKDCYEKIKKTNKYIEVNINKGIFKYNGWLSLNSSKNPTVIFFCGRGRTASDILYEMRIKNNEKYYTKNFTYNLLLINYPGCGQSKGFSNEAQINIMNNEIHKYILQSSHFKNKKQIIIGNSLGTGPAILYAEKFKPKLLILISPYYNGLSEYEKNLHIKLPNIFILNQYLNNEHIKNIKSKIIILASKTDKIININSSYKLYKGYPNKNNIFFYKFDNIIHRQMITDKEPVKCIYNNL